MPYPIHGMPCSGRGSIPVKGQPGEGGWAGKGCTSVPVLSGGGGYPVLVLGTPLPPGRDLGPETGALRSPWEGTSNQRLG